jgi:hypothetical protein
MPLEKISLYILKQEYVNGYNDYLVYQLIASKRWMLDLNRSRKTRVALLRMPEGTDQ